MVSHAPDVTLQMSRSGMQLPMKVKACAIVHPGSMQVRFLACVFLAGRLSFICHEGLEWFDLEDRWTSVCCLRSFQN